MRQLYRDLSMVYGFALRGDAFADPANRDGILAAMYSLSGNTERLAAHGDTVNPTTAYFRRSLARDAYDAVSRFREGRFEGSRFLVDQLMNGCFECHSRLPSERAFLLGAPLLEHLATDTLNVRELARLQVTMRQFHAALGTYEQMFASGGIPAAKIAASGAFEDYLRICLRVEDDCERAIETFAAFRERPDLPAYLEARMGLWIGDLEQLRKKRRRAQRDLLSLGRELIRDAQYDNTFPNDPRGMVRFMAATGYLNRFIESSPAERHRLAEAYYLLGVAESYVSPSYWRSQTDVLLERAIRTSPRSVYGRMALSFLEEYTISGYTGSSGVNVPPDVQARLDELRSLVENDG
jgi:hypothetical protein